MFWLLVVAVVLALVVAGGLVTVLVRKRNSDEADFAAGETADGIPVQMGPVHEIVEYRRRDFLTPAERSFFGVLQSAVDPGILLFAKVRVSDLVSIQEGWSNGHQASINQQHVDFVLCDGSTATTVLAIELDDGSHGAKKQQERDAKKDAVFAAAGIPLLRVPARRLYSVTELRDAINARSKSDVR